MLEVFFESGFLYFLLKNGYVVFVNDSNLTVKVFETDDVAWFSFVSEMYKPSYVVNNDLNINIIVLLKWWHWH